LGIDCRFHNGVGQPVGKLPTVKLVLHLPMLFAVYVSHEFLSC
jgi:hypothetical protein